MRRAAANCKREISRVQRRQTRQAHLSWFLAMDMGSVSIVGFSSGVRNFGGWDRFIGGCRGCRTDGYPN
jgi:hypothetical protein